MSKGSTFVSNNSNSLRSVPGALALVKTISSAVIVAKTDAAMAEAPTGPLQLATERLVCQVTGGNVFLNLHNAAAPSASNALNLPAGLIMILSRSQWLSSTWLRVSVDAVLIAQQMGAN